MAQKQTALITGASSGIGLELSKVFARHQYNLVLVARNQERLNQLKDELESQFQITVKILARDLTNPQAAKDIYEQVLRESTRIDVLVNNAGFAEYGPFVELSPEAQLNSINLNIYSLTYLTRLFLADMVKNKNGKILNVTSTAAFQPGPLMAVYYASKAYVLSFSEAIKNEVKDSGVSVTALCPGPTKTDFLTKQPGLANSRLLKSGESMNAAEVAEIGFKGLMAGKSIVIPGFRNKLLAFGTRLLPRNLITAISKWTLDRSKS